jgi:hypothetical protein
VPDEAVSLAEALRDRGYDTTLQNENVQASLHNCFQGLYEDNMQSESLKHLIFDDSGKSRPLYFDDVREHDRVDALLENGFKLIAFRDGTYELYDLLNDERGLNNIAVAHEDKVQEMLPKLLAQREANKPQQAANLARLDGIKDELSEEEKEELQKELKALGYIE